MSGDPGAGSAPCPPPSAGPPVILVDTSVGGHLTEVDFLRRAMGDRVRVVLAVNAEGPLPRSGYECIHRVRHAVRSPAVLVNVVEAWRLLGSHRPAAVLSCGAGVAVGFGVAARLRGVPVVHVESFSAVTDPTLTGRIMSRLANAFFVQWPALRARFPRARYEGPVAVAEAGSGTRTPGRGVFATLGNALEPFPRFAGEVAAIAALRPEVPVLFQAGRQRAALPPLPPNVEAVEFLGYEEFGAALRAAERVFSHAGSGTVLRCLEAGLIPRVLHRSAALGEHVDDHQAQIVEEMGRAGLLRPYRGAADFWDGGSGVDGAVPSVRPNEALAAAVLEAALPREECQ